MKRITYWYDSTSDEHGWIVDESDDIGSTTLSIHHTEGEACAEAMRVGDRRGLPVVRIDAHGVEECIAD